MINDGRHYTQPVERPGSWGTVSSAWDWLATPYRSSSQGLTPVSDPQPPKAKDAPSYVRTTDGTVVREGQVTNESWAARLWRWPTKWLPDAVVARPALAIVVAVTPFAVWGLVAWYLFRRFKR